MYVREGHFWAHARIRKRKQAVRTTGSDHAVAEKRKGSHCGSVAPKHTRCQAQRDVHQCALRSRPRVRRICAIKMTSRHVNEAMEQSLTLASSGPGSLRPCRGGRRAEPRTRFRQTAVTRLFTQVACMYCRMSRPYALYSFVLFDVSPRPTVSHGRR